MSDRKAIEDAVADSATDNFACFKCGVKPGQVCRTRNGKLAVKPHSDRKARAWASIIDDKTEDRKARLTRLQGAAKKARRVVKRSRRT